MKVKDAVEITGGLSKPSKMPGAAYGLPARACKVGGVLNKLTNTVCSKCYALKGMYQFPAVQAAQQKRLRSIEDPLWVEAMILLISRQKEKFFRWHDSGDLQGWMHLSKICEVAKALPEVTFWLPTRELLLVTQYRKMHSFPDNLTVRVSAPIIDQQIKLHSLPTSSVHSKSPAKGHECPAPAQEGKCGSCRACWDPSVLNVSYKEH
jgi:hypothetical protein